MGSFLLPKKEMSRVIVNGITYKKPLACCGFCDTPVFVLHKDVQAKEQICESILKSKGIPPQLDPFPEQEPRCAICGKVWTQSDFTLREGEVRGRTAYP